MLGTGVRADAKKSLARLRNHIKQACSATDFPLLKDMGAQLQLASRSPVLKDTLSQAQV